MKIAVLGSGYVGLVAGACLAEAGNHVTMIDRDAHRVDMIRRGVPPIYEPGLAEVLRNGLDSGRLRATTDTAEGVDGAEVVLLAVGTPSMPDGSVDMRQIDSAAEAIGRSLTCQAVIATKSTVPVGTSERVRQRIAGHARVPFEVASNPEFLKEGAAVDDFKKPDRVIVGVSSDHALDVLRRMYAPFMVQRDRLIAMDPPSAELTKYAANAMLATRISFMNELSRLCEHYGADIGLVRQGMGTDRRIGPDFLYASLGYGGSCFPKDVAALSTMGRDVGMPQTIVEAVQEANRAQRERLFHRLVAGLGGDARGRTVAVWGLAFKARTDDVRDSAAITLCEHLLTAGATVRVHDPKARETAAVVLGDRVTWCDDPYVATDSADALLIATEWADYRMPDLDRLAGQLRQRLIVDGRNLYDRKIFEGTGLTYVSIGRPTVG